MLKEDFMFVNYTCSVFLLIRVEKNYVFQATKKSNV